MRIWSDYYEKRVEEPPRDLLVEAVQLVEGRERALDLGAGPLVDTRHLLESGFTSVIAVDNDDESAEGAKMICDSRLTFIQSTFQELSLPAASFDLVSAQYALPYIPPLEFEENVQKILRWVKPGGIFTCQLFGPHDPWTPGPHELTFVTREEAEQLVRGLDVLHFEDKERYKATSTRVPKRMHVFHIIARQRMREL